MRSMLLLPWFHCCWDSLIIAVQVILRLVNPTPMHKPICFIISCQCYCILGYTKNMSAHHLNGMYVIAYYISPLFIKFHFCFEPFNYIPFNLSFAPPNVISILSFKFVAYWGDALHLQHFLVPQLTFQCLEKRAFRFWVLSQNFCQLPGAFGAYWHGLQVAQYHESVVTSIL